MSCLYLTWFSAHILIHNVITWFVFFLSAKIINIASIYFRILNDIYIDNIYIDRVKGLLRTITLRTLNIGNNVDRLNLFSHKIYSVDEKYLYTPNFLTKRF